VARGRSVRCSANPAIVRWCSPLEAQRKGASLIRRRTACGVRMGAGCGLIGDDYPNLPLWPDHRKPLPDPEGPEPAARSALVSFLGSGDRGGGHCSHRGVKSAVLLNRTDGALIRVFESGLRHCVGNVGTCSQAHPSDGSNLSRVSSELIQIKLSG